MGGFKDGHEHKDVSKPHDKTPESKEAGKALHAEAQIHIGHVTQNCDAKGNLQHFKTDEGAEYTKVAAGKWKNENSGKVENIEFKADKTSNGVDGVDAHGKLKLSYHEDGSVTQLDEYGSLTMRLDGSSIRQNNDGSTEFRNKVGLPNMTLLQLPEQDR